MVRYVQGIHLGFQPAFCRKELPQLALNCIQLFLKIIRIDCPADLLLNGSFKLPVVNQGRDDRSHIPIKLRLLQICPERASVAGLAARVLAVVVIPDSRYRDY